MPKTSKIDSLKVGTSNIVLRSRPMHEVKIILQVKPGYITVPSTEAIDFGTLPENFQKETDKASLCFCIGCLYVKTPG